MKGLCCACVFLVFAFAIQSVSGGSYPHPAGAVLQKRKPLNKPIRLRIGEPNGAMFRAKGSKKWRMLKKGEVITVAGDFLTKGRRLNCTADIVRNRRPLLSQVGIIFEPDTAFSIDSDMSGQRLTLDPNNDHPNSKVTINEDLSDKRNRFLSTFRVLCRIRNLTLGGHGTSYRVGLQHSGGDHAAMEVWELDALGGKDMVWSLVRGAHVGTLASGKHGVVGANGVFTVI